MAAHFYIRDDDGEWVEVTDRINLREPPTLPGRAEEGAAGFGSVILDDRDLSLEITPFTQFLATEDASESEDKVWAAGMLAGRKVVRVAGGYRDPIGRFWVCEFVDVNERWHRRILRGADWNRGEETDNERVADVLAQMVTWGLLDDDTTYVSTSNPSGDLDAEDFRRRYPDEIMGDASEAKSKNWWIQRQGDIGSLTDVAWWGRSGNNAYSSPLFLTNDLAEIGPRVAAIRDGTSDVWPLRMDHGLRCIPERMVSGVLAPNRSGAVYRRANGAGGRPDTVSIIGVRDMVMTGTEQKSKTVATNRALRYLETFGQEEYRVEGRVRLPASKVTQLRAGMRVPVAMTHWPFGLDEWTWWRAVTVQPTPAAAGPWYDLDIELVSTGDAASAPPEPPYEGDAFAGIMEVIDASGSSGVLTFAQEGDTGGGGWYPMPSMGPLEVVQSSSPFWQIRALQAITVRIEARVDDSSVFEGPGSMAVSVSVNGSPLATDSQSVGGGIQSFPDPWYVNVPSVTLQAGDLVTVTFTGTLDAFWTNSTNECFLRVGRGTHLWNDETVEWVGP